MIKAVSGRSNGRRVEQGGCREEEGGRRKEEGGRRKDGAGRRKEERGMRKEEGGRRKEEGGRGKREIGGGEMCAGKITTERDKESKKINNGKLRGTKNRDNFTLNNLAKQHKEYRFSSE